MVQFLPLDVTNEDSIGTILSHIDNAIQCGTAFSFPCLFCEETYVLMYRRYGEHEEPKEPKDLDEGDFDVGE